MKFITNKLEYLNLNLIYNLFASKNSKTHIHIDTVLIVFIRQSKIIPPEAVQEELYEESCGILKSYIRGLKCGLEILAPLRTWDT